MRHEFGVQREVDGTEAEIEDPVGDEQERCEPAGVLLPERRCDQEVGVRSGTTTTDDVDQVVAPNGEVVRVGAELLDPDRHADASPRLRDRRQAAHPGRGVRQDAHEDGPLAGAGLRGDGGGHGSMSSVWVWSVPPLSALGE